MSLDEFHKLKTTKSKVVITTCFLSASLDKEVAVFFSGGRQVTDGNVAVIFRMIIDKFTNKSKPFAFIGKGSTTQDEAEFLIAPGTIFQNRDINQTQENMFEVVLTHTLEEEKLQDEFNRSRAMYLERAQNIESVDDFESLIADASNELNEQEIPLPSPPGLDDGQRNTPSIEPQPAPRTEPQITHQVQERLSETRFSSIRTSLPASKRLFKELNQLRSLNTRADGSTIFTIDQTPFDNVEEDNGSQSSNVIICRIFPCPNIYNQCPYKIEITFPASYPFDPPKVRFLNPIYHPNVSKDGEICMNILQHTGSWTTRSSLTSVLSAVVDLIDNPNIDEAVNMNMAREYVENRAEFNRKALHMVTKYGLPG